MTRMTRRLKILGIGLTLALPALPVTRASVSGDNVHTCSLKVDGSVACWGWDGSGQSTPQEGEFASVSAGGDTPAG